MVKAYLQSLDHFYKFLKSDYCTVSTFDLLSSVQAWLRLDEDVPEDGFQ